MHSLGATAGQGALLSTMNSQGQFLFDPPSVFGWPSGMHWVNTGSMMNRFNFPLAIQTSDQTSDQNSASQLDPNDYFGFGMPEWPGVQDLLDTLYPDGMPSEVVDVIRSSTASCPTPRLKTINTIRMDVHAVLQPELRDLR